MPPRFKTSLLLTAALAGVLALTARAPAVSICLEHSVSLDTKFADTILTGKVISNTLNPPDPAVANLPGSHDTGVVVFSVSATLQGKAAGDITFTWEDPGKGISSAHNFKPGERLVVLLLNKEGTHRFLSAMYLENDADEKDFIASYAEIAPFIPLLDSATGKDAPPAEKLSAAIIKLAASKNRFTLCTLAYFVIDSLANKIDPAPYTAAIIACLHSDHFAPICSAAAWAAHSTDRALLPHLKKIADTKAALTRTLALNAAGAIEAATQTAAAAPPAADFPPIADFKPSRDSFAFANAFPGLPLKISLFDRPGQIYGLCGGMSFAAADFFLHRQPTPHSASTPQKGSPLWAYLFQRQADTLDAGIAEKFILWTNLEDVGRFSVPALTVGEVAAAKKLLDAHRPALLGLITASDPADVFANHQILVYRYETKGDTVIFHTYDPNFPRDDNRILLAEPFIQSGKLELLSGEKIPSMKISRGNADDPKSFKTVRGFFVTPYSAKNPQAAVATQPK